jgi:hypothetical protein
LQYLNDIIVQTLNQKESTYCNDIDNFDWNGVNPCATMPPNTYDINFKEDYERDLTKLINMCNHHICNPACYKNDKDAMNKLCRYGFPHKIVNETHFNDETELLHIKQIDQWINNANPTVMVYCR